MVMPSSGGKTSTREKKSSGSSSSKKSKKDKEPLCTEQRKRDKKKSKQRSKSPKTTKERGKTSSSTPSGKQSPPLLESHAAPHAQESSSHAQQPPPPLPSEQDPKASQDFEAGQLFQKFARNGGVDARDFQRLWRQRGTSIRSATPKDCDNGAEQSGETTLGKELRKTTSGGDARDVRPENTFEVVVVLFDNNPAVAAAADGFEEEMEMSSSGHPLQQSDAQCSCYSRLSTTHAL